MDRESSACGRDTDSCGYTSGKFWDHLRWSVHLVITPSHVHIKKTALSITAVICPGWLTDTATAAHKKIIKTFCLPHSIFHIAEESQCEYHWPIIHLPNMTVQPAPWNVHRQMLPLKPVVNKHFIMFSTVQADSVLQYFHMCVSGLSMITPTMTLVTGGEENDAELCTLLHYAFQAHLFPIQINFTRSHSPLKPRQTLFKRKSIVEVCFLFGTVSNKSAG